MNVYIIATIGLILIDSWLCLAAIKVRFKKLNSKIYKSRKKSLVLQRGNRFLSSDLIQNILGHECSSSESIACGQEIQALKSERNRYYYASDDKTLAEMCRKQFVAVKCVNSFAEECLPKNERAQFEVMIQGAHKFFNDFCFENGSMRKQYLKHFNCLRSISDELDSCTEKYLDMQKKIDSEVIEGNLLLQKTCCIYFENIRCSENISSSICGNEAADLVTQLLTLLSGTFLSERCKLFFDYDSSSCSLISKSVVLVPNLTLLLLLFLMSHNITLLIRTST